MEEPHYLKLLAFCLHADVKAKAGMDFAESQGMECLKGLAGVIQRGIYEGIFSPSVNAWKAAAIWWATSIGILLLLEQDPEREKKLNLEVEELLLMYTELFIQGLKGKNHE